MNLRHISLAAVFLRHIQVNSAWVSVSRPYSRSRSLFRYRLPDSEIEESFTKGSGPGGQKINKVNNCVQLKHVPTGTTVACQESRSLAANRAIARKLLEKKVEYAKEGINSSIGRAITKKQKQKQRNYRRAQMKVKARSVAKGEKEEIDGQARSAIMAPPTWAGEGGALGGSLRQVPPSPSA